MASFIHNLGLFLLRLVTGSLVSYFAAREMANRSDIIYQTLEFFNIAGPDIAKVFLGCLILILGFMLIIGFWTRLIALVLLVLLAIGGYCWAPQASHLSFQIEAVYGILFFYLFLVGGGQWAVTGRKALPGQSVLESEQSKSILTSDNRPSIFQETTTGESKLTPPPPPEPVKEPSSDSQDDPDDAVREENDDEEQQEGEDDEEDYRGSSRKDFL